MLFKPVPSTAIVFPCLSRAPLWANPSMPIASPLVIVKPASHNAPEN